MLPEEAGNGAMPPRAANAASERTRPWCEYDATRIAPVTAPTPGRLEARGESLGEHGVRLVVLLK